MKCQNCDHIATVHLTKIVDKCKTEVHLCQECALKQNVLQDDEQSLSLSNILQTLIAQHVGGVTEELGRLICPTCGIKYMQFRAEGRLGCPGDYALFRAGLEPLLFRIHRAVRHKGKTPRRRDRTDRPGDLLDLRQKLRRAVETEDYEAAATLRDAIRRKEASDEPGPADPNHG